MRVIKVFKLRNYRTLFQVRPLGDQKSCHWRHRRCVASSRTHILRTYQSRSSQEWWSAHVWWQSGGGKTPAECNRVGLLISVVQYNRMSSVFEYVKHDETIFHRPSALEQTLGFNHWVILSIRNLWIPSTSIFKVLRNIKKVRNYKYCLMENYKCAPRCISHVRLNIMTLVSSVIKKNTWMCECGCCFRILEGLKINDISPVLPRHAVRVWSSLRNPRRFSR